MPNTAYNAFVIILGFCLLGLPIILISLSTSPPGLNEFQSTITINTIPGDQNSGIYLNNTALVNGSSLFYWDDLKPLAELSYINNISELIEREQAFMANVSMDDYIGYSKKVHVFVLEMTIQIAPSTNISAIQQCKEIFGESNGTFQFYFWMPDDYRSFYFMNPNYESINESVSIVYDRTTVSYAVIVNFYANINVNGTQITTEFSRYLLLDSSGVILYFITNEDSWKTVNTEE
ncbi:MAG: hypothetical protein ACTSX6_03820 [Candidatus Heimdallarchaeaceae archaeon]